MFRSLVIITGEIKVAHHVRAGYEAKEIAEFMNIAPSTVHVHKEKIRRKLGLTGKPINLKTFLSDFYERSNS
ncbi:MAG: LuxR C-terminal-related transcriptional regulator [Pseudomonadota bacterium]